MSNPGESTWRRNRAARLLDEIRQVVPDAPGDQPLILERARRLGFEIGADYELSSNTRMKMAHFVEFLGYWCSCRKWQKWDPVQLHCLIMQARAAVEAGIRRDLEH